MIDVSIIIPSHNRLWSLQKAVESCCPTICKVQIIVVDDGSEDGTQEWLKGRDKISSFWQTNQGKCAAVNRGYRLAKGKYVRFLDSDDMLSAKSIDEQFILAEGENADIVVSGYQVIDEKEKIFRVQDWVDCDDFIAQQLGECDSSHYSAYLFRRDFLKDIAHQNEFAYRDDRMFVLKAALNGPRISVHRGHSLFHRHHFRSRLQFTTGEVHKTQNSQHLNIYKTILQNLADTNRLNQRRKDAAINVLWPLAKWTSKYSIDEGVKIWNWIRELNTHFKPKEFGALNNAYRFLGFRNTQYLLRLRRLLKYN